MLYFMIGLPRGGKSTYADWWVRQQGIRPRAIVCADNIRIALHGHRYYGPAEAMVHAIKDTMIKSLLLRDHDVIVDGTHTTLGSIRSMLQHDNHAEFLYIETPANICKERAIACNQEDLLPVIDRMAQQIAVLKEPSISFNVEKIRAEVLSNSEYSRKAFK